MIIEMALVMSDTTCFVLGSLPTWTHTRVMQRERRSARSHSWAASRRPRYILIYNHAGDWPVQWVNVSGEDNRVFKVTRMVDLHRPIDDLPRSARTQNTWIGSNGHANGGDPMRMLSARLRWNPKD
jgi:hypothetical protein